MFKLLKMRIILSTLLFPAFILMIYVNYLSGIGAINDISAGGVSGKYPTLFTPAGFTFSIWGLIYLSGLIFVVRLIRDMFVKKEDNESKHIVGLYILSCMLNISWIYSWHYDWIGVSVILMIGLLFTLIILYLKVIQEAHGSIFSYLTLRTPISIYLGWICIATVANISVWLTALNWDGRPLNNVFWASLMLIIAALLNLFILIKKRDIFFAMVYLWAAYGIIMARSAEMPEGNTWISGAAVGGMIMVFLGILFAHYIKVNKVRESAD